MALLTSRYEDYLALRRALGHDLKSQERIVKPFTKYCDELNSPYLTLELFKKWKPTYGNANRTTWAHRYGIIRKFSLWLNSHDDRNEALPKNYLVPGKKSFNPFIYSDQEILDICNQALKLNSPYGLRRQTYCTLYGLISVTAMRISEALSIRDNDISFSNNAITITDAKNGKVHDIPVTNCTTLALKSYIDFRNKIIKPRNTYLFLKADGSPVSKDSARKEFGKIGQKIGLRKAEKHNRNGKGPRLHDLRHTFVVRSLIDFYKQDLNVDAEIYKLSTILGHQDPSHIYDYITAVPELLQLASKRTTKIILRKRLS